MGYNRKIANIVDSLKNGKESGKKCSLLIGAGCSVTADVPTAQGFVEEIERRYNDCFKLADSKTYPKCMSELAPGQRKSLIKEFVDNAKINWAHLCIAQLMKEGYIDRVLTTNFDLLVVRACALLGEFPSVYDFASSQILKPAEITANAVFYLHGQYTGFVLMNTEDEVNRHSKLLAPVFDDAGRGRTWIVVGYSGENDPVFDHLSSVGCFDDNLYWVGYGKNPPAKHISDKLLLPNKYAFFVEDYDADRFFISLTRELNCFPPKIFSKPFTHLFDIFNSFTPFPVLDSDLDSKKSFDITEKTRKLIKSAIKTFEKGEVMRRKAVTELQKSLIKAEEFYMKGDYKKVIGLEDQIKKDKKVIDMLYWSYIGLGNEAWDKSNLLFGIEKEKYLKNTAVYYEKARSIKKTGFEALSNWGLALSELAELKEKPAEKEQLHNQAIKKYEESIKIKHDYHVALNNWGLSLFELAELKEKPEEKEQLYNQAIKKYEESIKIKPDHHTALNNWGSALSELAKLKEKPGEIEQLYNQVFKKYEESLKIKPDKHLALYNWGNALFELAEKKEKSEEKEQLYNQAIKKYEESIKIKSDYHLALNNWGLALTYLAKIEENPEEKVKILEGALEVLYQAEKIKEGHCSYDIACVYSLINEPDKCKEYLVRAKEFNTLPNCEHLKTDTDLDNVRELDWYIEFEKEICKNQLSN